MPELKPLELTLTGLSMEDAGALLKEFGGAAHKDGGAWTYTLGGETDAAGVAQVRRDLSALLGREV